MSQILIVSKTHMRNGLCISGIDLATRASLRLLPQGANSQPSNSPLDIGDVWEATYRSRGTPAPFVEDADTTLGSRLRSEDVGAYIEAHLPVVVGTTDAIYEGRLDWNPHKGYLEPLQPTGYSTQFWRTAENLIRYDENESFIFWEPVSKRRIRWVGVAAAPERIPAGSLVRLSLSRPFAGNLDHDVCWLQLSGVY
jgi:hypothetical protein